MTYMDQLQAGLKSLVMAGEAGRHSVDQMLAPMNGALGDIREAASALEGLPYIGPAIGVRLQRTLRAITSAQTTVGTVLAQYDRAVAVVAQVQERISDVRTQVARASTAINRVAGRISPSLGDILPARIFAFEASPAGEAVKPFPHLLILQPLTPQAPGFYFNLDTAAFDTLRRETRFRWAGQERLARSTAQQAVGLGGETISIKGAIFPAFKGGLGQLQALRSIGRQLQPMTLTTGYGEVLGTWCLTRIDEDQGHLLAGGIPRKQAFSLEFASYGNDMQNV